MQRKPGQWHVPVSSKLRAGEWLLGAGESWRKRVWEERAPVAQHCYSPEKRSSGSYSITRWQEVAITLNVKKKTKNKTKLERGLTPSHKCLDVCGDQCATLSNACLYSGIAWHSWIARFFMFQGEGGGVHKERDMAQRHRAYLAYVWAPAQTKITREKEIILIS